MVKSKEELLTAIKSKLGEDTSDETLAFMEDVTDTIADYESKANDTTDWKAKYEENDKTWREKYRDRFFNSSNEDNDNSDDEEEPKRPMTFDELFKREG